MASPVLVSWMELGGINETLAMLNDVQADMRPKLLAKVLKHSGNIMANEVRKSVRSRGWVDTGYMTDTKSIKAMATPSKYAPNMVVLRVGAWKAYPMMRASGLNPKKDIPAPTKLYWMEHGIDPHSTTKGANKRRSKRRGYAAQPSVHGKNHPGYAATPVLAPAVNANMDIMQADLVTYGTQIFRRAIARHPARPPEVIG